MGRKRLTVIIASLLCVVVVGVGTTLAVLIAISGPVENTFTVGDIEITLEETASDGYQLIPGKTYAKDPKITVKSGSEDCWLFVNVDKTAGFDDYISYAIDDGWSMLHGGVYYREVTDIDSDTVFEVIQDNTVTVKDGLTEEQIGRITENPKITFSAYAVQSYGIETAFAAWEVIQTEMQD